MGNPIQARSSSFHLLLFSIALASDPSCPLEKHQFPYLRDDQKTALLQSKQEFIRSDIILWEPETDYCLWEGVIWNVTTGYVIGLNLSSKLSKPIYDNSSLFGLNQLQLLNLAYNDFKFTPIPSGFDRLTYLTHLNLSNTCFSDQIPREFSNLTSLVSLDLSSDISCTPILDSVVELRRPKLESPNLQGLIQDLTSLIELYLDGVDLSSQGSDWSQVFPQALPNLRALSLSRCRLSGPVHCSLSQLVFLSQLRLDYNHLRIEAPKFLRKLQLSRCKINGSIPSSLANLTQLTDLNLSTNAFTGSIPLSLANLTQLSFLDLSFNSFTGSVPLFESISQLSRLEYLFLAANNFSGTVKLDMFGNLENLKILDLSNNQMSLEVGNSTSSALPNLKSCA
ncbi:hypothetical protein NE237_002503 [Protea cynaroides]|uniref:Leucine-rich repeat-containing N-terminal plant-type domain-containing protein n=1 Tax=Protea cynaroides TaxID=273540 RepID=A0A9Q0QZE8_9MAGN|nr:hypothetical protein NE237_002503 [Protea cynaroides]